MNLGRSGLQSLVKLVLELFFRGAGEKIVGNCCLHYYQIIISNETYDVKSSHKCLFSLLQSIEVFVKICALSLDEAIGPSRSESEYNEY